MSRFTPAVSVRHDGDDHGAAPDALFVFLKKARRGSINIPGIPNLLLVRRRKKKKDPSTASWFDG